MSTIYFDPYFSELFLNLVDHTPIHDYCQFDNTGWLRTLPNDCEIVGISFYTNRYHEYVNMIQYILPRTKKLLINLSEPTDTSILAYIEALNNPKITFFSDIIVNKESHASVKTNVSWFIQPTNFYKDHRWAKELLSLIESPRTWEPRPYVYDCLLGRRTPHRDIIEKLYNSCKFKDKFIYSYYKENINNGIWDQIESNNSNINIKVDDTHTVSRFAILPKDIYNNSYMSIVAETTANNHYTQFTEKIAKPILARRPFVVFAGQYYLQNLRQLGFKTFGTVEDNFGCMVIDETYDTIADDRARWKMAWHEIEKLHSVTDWNLLYQQVQHILDHNIGHFLINDWQSEIKTEVQKHLQTIRV